ncbi:MAG: 3-deoxy-7-phosphoheptulonate synthase [Elusimicrobia bacterium]|nr:3-deoxy-7-phosphoheptulonate synthase [Elusimicrobiota bacterium]
MLILMEAGHEEKQLEAVIEKVRSLGFKAHVIPGAQNVAVGVTGNNAAIDPRLFEGMPGVADAIPVTKPYKLAGRDFKRGETEIRVGGVVLGGYDFVVIAGPCAVESEEQTLRIARAVKKAGAHLLRGGAYKPRTSPYAFQGLGEEGLKILAAARAEVGLPIVTEVLDQRSLDAVAATADVLQVGARNMQNFALLKDLGKIHKPVMLKRGLSATLEEWLQSAEYILAEGNPDVFLCERGVRTFADHARNTLDLNVVPAIQELSHLPIFVDPSHATGLRRRVTPMARAAAAAGAHGVMVEVHDQPQHALCDGPQALSPDEFGHLMDDLDKLCRAIGKQLAPQPAATAASRTKSHR